ncbi:hypothetical protein GCK32_005637, partial [Trichostrongylus colubriformis]
SAFDRFVNEMLSRKSNESASNKLREQFALLLPEDPKPGRRESVIGIFQLQIGSCPRLLFAFMKLTVELSNKKTKVMQTFSISQDVSGI